MRKAFKYRLYLTRKQQERLTETLELCQELYNAALEERKSAYERCQKSLNYYYQAHELPAVKQARPDLQAVHSQVLQDVLRRVDRAFQGFFRRVKEKQGKAGYPRFKSPSRYNSFTYPQFGFELRSNGKLYLSKIGEVKIKLHRPVAGRVKTCTLKRTSTGKGFAIFSGDDVPAEIFPASTEEVGIDVGMENALTLSTGEVIENPRFLIQTEEKLVQAQRQLSHKAKGTRAREKARRKVAKLHEKVRNQRRDFWHKVALALVQCFGVF